MAQTQPRKVITDHIYPPIPVRHMDWCAWFEGEEEAGEYGYGPTEADAIADLLDNADEYPTALASEVDPHGLFERAYAEVAGVQP